MKMNSKMEDIMARVLSGNGSEEDALRLEQWLSESDTNRMHFQRTKAVWEQSKFLKKERSANVDHAWQDLQTRIMQSAAVKTPVRTIVYRVAAAIVLLAFLSVLINLVFVSQQSAPQLAVIQPSAVVRDTQVVVDDSAFFDLEDIALEETPDTTLPIKTIKPKAKYRKRTINSTYIAQSATDSARAFFLPDNSIVFLNANSTLTYSKEFGKGNREVVLEGEAYFEIQEDSLPFIVNCGPTQTRSQQAPAFNVRRNRLDNSVEVITVSGNVEFSGIGAQTFKTLELEQGDRVVYAGKDALMKEKNKRKDFKWWQKTNLRAKLRSLLNRIMNVFN